MRLENFKNVQTGIIIIIAGVLAFTGLVAVKGLVKPKEKNIVKINKTKSLPKKTIDASRSIIHTDLLDDTKAPGIPLNEALEKVGSGASLPDTSVVGEIVTVVLDDLAHYDTGKWGMGVLYETGIKLWIDPTQKDFQKTLERKSAPYTDGRKKSFAERQIAGRPSLVSDGGTQILSKGQVKVFPIVIWNMNGMNYQLRSTSDDVSLDDLIKAAESIK